MPEENHWTVCLTSYFIPTPNSFNSWNVVSSQAPRSPVHRTPLSIHAARSGHFILPNFITRVHTVSGTNYCSSSFCNFLQSQLTSSPLVSTSSANSCGKWQGGVATGLSKTVGMCVRLWRIIFVQLRHLTELRTEIRKLNANICRCLAEGFSPFTMDVYIWKQKTEVCTYKVFETGLSIFWGNVAFIVRNCIKSKAKKVSGNINSAEHGCWKF